MKTNYGHLQWLKNQDIKINNSKDENSLSSSSPRTPVRLFMHSFGSYKTSSTSWHEDIATQPLSLSFDIEFTFYTYVCRNIQSNKRT